MKGIKCYMAYTPTLFKLIVLVLLPVLVLGIECLNVLTDKVALFALISSGVVFYECLADVWNMGGLHSKDYIGIRMVQSSKRGLEFSKKVVLYDCLRKYVYMAVFAVANLLVLYFSIGREAVGAYAQTIWYVYWTSTATLMLFTLICRFICNITGIFVLTYMASIVASTLFALIVACNGHQTLWMVVMVVAPIVSIVMGCLLVLVGCKKMEGSYYDS